jgi:Arc/MetJ-type ribon-helix-helix transcriptional regulator
MVEKNKIKVSITLPQDVVEWGRKAVKEGRYAGVRSFSGLIEFLLRREMEKYEGK